MRRDPELRQPPETDEVPDLVDQGRRSRSRLVALVEEVTAEVISGVGTGVLVPDLTGPNDHSYKDGGREEKGKGVAETLDVDLGGAASQEVAGEAGGAIDEPHPDPVDPHRWQFRFADQPYRLIRSLVCHRMLALIITTKEQRHDYDNRRLVYESDV